MYEARRWFLDDKLNRAVKRHADQRQQEHLCNISNALRVEARSKGTKKSVDGKGALVGDVVDVVPVKLACVEVAALTQSHAAEVSLADVQMEEVVLAPDVVVWARVHRITVHHRARVLVGSKACMRADVTVQIQ